jgi:hypothetical protein
MGSYDTPPLPLGRIDDASVDTKGAMSYRRLIFIQSCTQAALPRRASSVEQETHTPLLLFQQFPRAQRAT